MSAEQIINLKRLLKELDEQERVDLINEVTVLRAENQALRAELLKADTLRATK